MDLLNKLNPELIVVSAGNKYWHPSHPSIPAWATLAYLNARLLDKPTKMKPLLATRYPYYCMPEGTSDKYDRKGSYGDLVEFVSGDIKLDNNSVWKQYLDDLANRYVEFNKTTKPNVQDFREQAKAFYKGMQSKVDKYIKEHSVENLRKLLIEYNCQVWMAWQIDQAWQACLSEMYSMTYRGKLEKSKKPLAICVTSHQESMDWYWVTIFQEVTETRVAGNRPATAVTAVPGVVGLVNLYGDVPDTLLGFSDQALKEAIEGADKIKRKATADEKVKGKRPKPSESDTVATAGSDMSPLLPIISNPSPAPTPSPPIPDGYWYAASTESTDPRIQTLPKGTDLDSFIGGLHWRMFGLTAKPAAGTAQQFLKKDEWLSWSTDTIGASQMTVITDNSGIPDSFQVQIPAPWSPKGLLSFDSAAVTAAFGLKTALPNHGIVSQLDTMVFALVSATEQSAHATLKDIFSYAGLSTLTNSPLGKVIGESVNLTLRMGPGIRNAVWFAPHGLYRTSMRLEWVFDDEGIKRLEQLFNFEGKIPIKSASLTTRIAGCWNLSTNGVRVATSNHALLVVDLGGNVFAGFQAVVQFDTKASWIELRLQTKDKDIQLTQILTWLSKEVKKSFNDLDPTVELQELLKAVTSMLDSIRIREFSIEIDISTGKPEIRSWGFTLEIPLKVDGSPTCVFTYWSMTGTLSGRLWFQSDDAIPVCLQPDWEEVLDLQPYNKSEKSYLDLNSLLQAGTQQIPQGLPTELVEASIEITKKSLIIRADAKCPVIQNTSSVPPVELEDISLYVEYDMTTKAVMCEAAFKLELISANEEYEEPSVILDGSILYDSTSKSWTLEAKLHPVTLGDLYVFFDPDAQDIVLDILCRLEVAQLDLTYNYAKGQGSSFEFAGGLQIGDLELDLTYSYSQDGWDLIATLGAASQGATLETIIEGLVGKEDSELLPSFIGNIPIPSAADKGAVKIHCARLGHSAKALGLAAPNDNRGVFFSVEVTTGFIGNIELSVTFIQYRHLDWQPGAAPKRVLRLAVRDLPTVMIDLIGPLPQPFDQMLYLWVKDPSTQSSSIGGLSREDINTINNELDPTGIHPEDRLIFRDTKKTSGAKDIVLASGSHFILVMREGNQRQALIDYVFQSSKKKLISRQVTTLQSGNAEDTGDTSMAPYNKKSGPISISNIGFTLKGSTVMIILDASFLLGPVGFTFIEAGIGLDLSKTHIQDISLKNVQFHLGGLAVQFDRSPVILAGEFTMIDSGNIKGFAGGIVVSFKPYMFAAAGFYGKVTLDHGGNEFTSVFVFARLDGPLVTLELAEISGITGGFGYNSNIKFPSVAEVSEFPFVSKTDLEAKPMDTVKKLVKADGTGWFSPRDGSFWLAAGLQVTAFETLVFDAVVVVSWNPKVKLGIFGIAVADIPKGSDIRFAHVELGIEMVVDFAAGVMKFEAQLAPSSYVFHPSCHLTGGFALYYWFHGSEESEHEGDWVFTIGGYHRAFQKPAHYPEPNRLGISWRYDSNISITGEAYFAITPKCCMGGGKLSAVYDTGPIRAWFDAWADFFINYKPFYFMADIGVSLGAQLSIDIGITTLRFSGELSASLSLAGPPLHGEVKVKILVCTVKVYFGESPSGPKPLSLEDFYKLVVQADKQSSLARTILDIGAGSIPVIDSKAHIFSCVQGMMEGDKDNSEVEEGAPWKVRSGNFIFAVHSTVSPSDEYGTPVKTGPSVEDQTDIFAKPMHLTSRLTSEITITIHRERQAVFLNDATDDYEWNPTKIMKAVPSALWGIYDASQDPQQRGSSTDELMKGDQPARNLLMGIQVESPKPQLSPDKIKKFNVVNAMKMQVTIDDPKKQVLPTFPARDGRWSPAPSTGDKTQWDKVKAQWLNPAQPHDRDVAVQCLPQILGWKNTSSLTAKLPNRLLDDFGNLYMAAPMLSVA
ncbi:hypothetical protein BGW36DRAFT_405079 [Talaromyces proteolyticus]|uniref:DUF6603 domain-containing protein n=1 Tax=Talaromyces proteolyticus TaxID=1131652 RepID=A0AAD4KXV2_9EURO|nr:uncharacterized protein BGW36DRAFT_405079 [Talaromyces proteolyticus]KAH8702265.1 hypothetical protein BGW36DRAFT_405079 [Talaromyces proteolyticus]